MRHAIDDAHRDAAAMEASGHSIFPFGLEFSEKTKGRVVLMGDPKGGYTFLKRRIKGRSGEDVKTRGDGMHVVWQAVGGENI
jgi:hypothetical protein